MPTGFPNPYKFGLEKPPANHIPLTPLGFIKQAAFVHPERIVTG
ncbi:MAG: hypothetical protein R3F37_03550 [Candidatus Competibacteraceae bacterium]